jgi:hypothetical protein
MCQRKMRRLKLSKILNKSIWLKVERYRVELEKFKQTLNLNLRFKVELEKSRLNLRHNP